jgi:hypothetical protein
MPITLSCLFSLFAACTVVPPQAWTFDPTQPPAKATLPMEQVVALTDRIAQLQLQRNDIRARIAGEPDAQKRLDLYGSLHRVGSELSRLDRRLSTVASAR